MRDATSTYGIVVGVDGSEPSITAVGWAAAEAARRALPLTVVTAVGGSGHALVEDVTPEVLDAAVRHAHNVAPDLRVGRMVREELPARALVELSLSAEVLVVGRRGAGGITRLLLGSTAQQVAVHAHCTTVVVPAAAATAGTGCVVGIDGSSRAEQALAYAFEAADLRSTGLRAVHAWRSEVFDAPAILRTGIPDGIELTDEQHRILAEALAGWSEKYPDVPVDARVRRGHAVEVLAEESVGAALLVVAARGRGGFPALRLGSVSSALVMHAPCPVAVVRTGH